MRYHEQQRGLWCGMHAIHNAVQTPWLSQEDFMRQADELYARTSESIMNAIDEEDRRLVTPWGNVDVSLVVHMLEYLGYTPELVYNFERALRLASSADVDGTAFIINTGGHYVTYALDGAVWHYHDSMWPQSVEVPHKAVLSALARASEGKRYALGRRVVHFVKYI